MSEQIQNGYDWDLQMPHMFGVFDDRPEKKQIQIVMDLLRSCEQVTPSMAEGQGALYLASKVATLRSRGWHIKMHPSRRSSEQESTYTLISEPTSNRT